MSATSRGSLSTSSKAIRSVFTSKPFLFQSRVDEVPARAAYSHTIGHKVSHSSVIEHAKRKVKTSGPAHIVVELEQTLYSRRHKNGDVSVPSKRNARFAFAVLSPTHDRRISVPFPFRSGPVALARVIALASSWPGSIERPPVDRSVKRSLVRSPTVPAKLFIAGVCSV